MWRISTFSALALAFVTMPAVADGPSRGIVVGDDGSVYFSDLRHIRKIDPKGRMRVVRANAEGHTHALALARDGSIWGDQAREDAGGERSAAIWRMLPDGSLTYRFGPSERIAPGVGLLRDGAGCTWHAGQAPSGGAVVLRKCPGAEPRRMFGSAADARTYVPSGVADLAGSALTADGDFVFRQRGIVRRIGPDASLRVLARGLGRDEGGLALAAGEAVYVAETARRRVSLLVPGRPRRTVARTAAPWRPTGVAWREGILYVLELDASGQRDRLRVRRLAEGGETVLATVNGPAQAVANPR